MTPAPVDRQPGLLPPALSHLSCRWLLSPAAALALLAGCGGGEAPSDHTVSRNGVMHKPGLNSPLTNCVACHGAALKGGRGPSCTSCHGVKW